LNKLIGSARLQRLVSSLMDFSRLEAGKMQASFVPVNIASFTEELTDLFRAAMEKVRASL
jgi:signal transduction histidine kinase